MGVQSVNEVVNDSSMILSKRKFNDKSMIINDKSLKGSRSHKVAYTEYVADKLVKVFNAPRSRNFFLKCAWNLSESTIWSAVDDSRKKCVKNPIGLFIFICNNAMRELPIKH